jgi:hypothetical protein
MINKILYFLALIMVFPYSYSQQIKIVNNKNNLPLCDVLIFDLKENFKAKTSIEGTLEKSKLADIGANFVVSYKTTFIDTLSLSDIKNDTIRLFLDKIYLDEVVVKNRGKKSNKFTIEGYFNSYLTNNNQITEFVEGIVQYFFDSKSKKYKGKNVLQYRIFKLDEKLNPVNRKNTATYIFNNFKLPEIKQIYDMEEIRVNKKYNFKEIELENSSKRISFRKNIYENKTLNLFGYSFSNLIETTNISFNSNKIIPEDIEFYNFSESFLFKRKSEKDFNTYSSYSNFYPISIVFSDDFETNGVKIKKNHSCYHSDFLQKIPFYRKEKATFQSFEKLIEVENILKD